MRTRHFVVAALALVTLVLAAPVSTRATLLWGHPYVMLYDRDNASVLYNAGVVFMWNDLDPSGPYVGAARIRDLATGGFFAKETWDALFQGMLHKKLTYIWTDSGADTVINDGSIGDLEAFAVTIFGG